MNVDNTTVTPRERELLEMIATLLYALESGDEPPFDEATALIERVHGETGFRPSPAQIGPSVSRI